MIRLITGRLTGWKGNVHVPLLACQGEATRALAKETNARVAHLQFFRNVKVSRWYFLLIRARR